VCDRLRAPALSAVIQISTAINACENHEVIVRAATATDASGIASLVNAFIATTTIEWTDTPHTTDDMVEWIDEHETVLVADEHGEIVGVAAFGWFRDVVKRPGYRFTVENTIHVREDRWGNGIGRDLMGALIDAARDRGMHTMVAAIDSANDASIRFHEQLGFAEVARLPQVGAKFGRWLDLVFLQLRLDDRTAPPAGRAKPPEAAPRARVRAAPQDDLGATSPDGFSPRD
jgi:L-amino acid N-acyltransferase